MWHCVEVSKVALMLLLLLYTMFVFSLTQFTNQIPLALTDFSFDTVLCCLTRLFPLLLHSLVLRVSF